MKTPRIEEMRKRYVEMWDRGEFEWNHHEGDKLGEKPISPERIWQTFIEPALTQAHQAGIDEAVEKVKEIKANRKIPYQALRLSGGCPDCGAEVNQSFVDNEFKEAVDQALDDTIKALQNKK